MTAVGESKGGREVLGPSEKRGRIKEVFVGEISMSESPYQLYVFRSRLVFCPTRSDLKSRDGVHTRVSPNPRTGLSVSTPYLFDGSFPLRREVADRVGGSRIKLPLHGKG